MRWDGKKHKSLVEKGKGERVREDEEISGARATGGPGGGIDAAGRLGSWQLATWQSVE